MSRRYVDRIFGTQVTVVGLDDPAGALGWLRRVETVLSRFDPSSDLSRLNRERSGVCDPILVELLLAAVAWERRTRGMVSPFLGRLVAAHGYDRDFALLPQHPDTSPAAVPDDAEHDTADELVIEVETRRVVLPGGVDLDFGGFAKGWAAEQVRRRDHSRRGLVDVGGDITAWSDHTPWRVGIEGTHRHLSITDGAVATSSILHRRWWHGSRRVHHLIDPAQGQPTNTDCVQATVTAHDALTAEVAAKIAVLSGMSAAPVRLSQLGLDTHWVLVADSGRVEDNLPPEPVSSRTPCRSTRCPV